MKKVQLDRAYQNEKSVSEYAHELEELFNMISSIDEHEQVVKFWKGCKPIIQKALLRDGLNPDISSWDEVTCKAEIIEILENIMEPREKKGGDSSSKKGGSNSNNPSSYKGNSSNSRGSSSRALVPLHSEVLNSPVHLPTTQKIPGKIDLTRDDLSVEEADF